MQRQKILVIDDDPAILEIISDILSLDNYQILTALNGLAGLSLLESEAPHLVVCDINLPDMNGMDICTVVKRDYPHVLFLFLSGLTDETDKMLGLELGAEDYITKPISMREFRARVRAVLRRLNYVSPPSLESGEQL